MVRRFHRSIYDELDELRASMDYLYQLALEPTDNPLLPQDETPVSVYPYIHNLNAEVTESDNEVTVTVDTAPGPGNSKISVDLINDTALVITCDREEEACNEAGGNTVCEERLFSRHRLVPLPAPVIHHGARMSMRNGVLDIHLNKARRR
jgi:HSP20 family molecular chaperone IbpA